MDGEVIDGVILLPVARKTVVRPPPLNAELLMVNDDTPPGAKMTVVRLVFRANA